MVYIVSIPFSGVGVILFIFFRKYINCYHAPSGYVCCTSEKIWFVQHPNSFFRKQWDFRQLPLIHLQGRLRQFYHLRAVSNRKIVIHSLLLKMMLQVKYFLEYSNLINFLF